MNRVEHARALRAKTDVHHNCCQSVLMAFAKEMGMSQEEAYALGSHFGSGMRRGGACGALTGGLMVLGTLGRDHTYALSLLSRFEQAHDTINCDALLQSSLERGEVKKEHCDNLVCELVAALEETLELQPAP